MSQTTHISTDQPYLLQSTLKRLWPVWVEFAILLVTAPLLYFPNRIQSQLTKICGCEVIFNVPVVVPIVVLAVLLLALLWPLRRWQMGYWAAPLPFPVSWAMWFWFVVMLPVAIWAAPLPLREQYSWPRAYILVWNFSLFWSVIAYASRDRRLLGWALVGWLAAVQGIALLAPFGMEARAKLPVVGRIQDLIPRPLMGMFAGAESGFSTNQVAGVLLYVVPLMVALCVAGLRQRGWRWWLLLLCIGWMGATLLLTQSRGGLLGLLVALVAVLLLSQRWGWYALALLTVIGALFIFFVPVSFLDLISDSPGVNIAGGVVTVRKFRSMVWEVGNLALRDFFFTGMGLGAFRALVHLLYPLPGIPADYDLAHAHNFFLQTGLDFGVPGLVAILMTYVAAIVQLVRLTQARMARAIWPQFPYVTPRVLAIGWMGCMVGQTVYSLFDAVTMGSKPNFVWWWWLALIFAAANYLLREDETPEPKGSFAAASAE